jgi:hypothetical protein
MLIDFASVVTRCAGRRAALTDRTVAVRADNRIELRISIVVGEGPRRCVAQSRCTPPRAITTAPTPSSFISYHPHFSNTAILDTQCGSYWSAVFTFETTEPEKWIDKSLIPTTHTSHAVARCPGAIDALCLMHTTTKYTKKAMFPHTGTWTLNEFVLVGGDATSDNLPPRVSQIQYAWRSPSLGIQQQIYTVLEQNARHVAAMTGCHASVRWITKTRIGLTNHAMTDMTFANMKLVGPPRFSDEARDFARQIQANLGLEPMENPFLDDSERLMPPAEIRDPVAPRLARVADPLHLGRLRRLHLARADRAAVDDAAAAAPPQPRLRITGLGAQRAGRSAGGDQSRYLSRR